MEREPQIDIGEHEGPTPWADREWRQAALAWAEEAIAGRALRPRAREEWLARLRPWSVVVRIPTVSGETVWFKANPPGSAFEPALTRALHGWVPGRVLAPLAVDTARAWALLPDGGPLLAGTADRPGGSPYYWEAPLRAYAALQRATAHRAEEMAALGVPDLRPARLPELLDELIERTDAPAEVRAVRPRFADWCAELDGSGIGATLDHADLHEDQVFHRGDAYVFFDWGDAALAHPFTSLLVTARMAHQRYGADGPEVVARLRDRYLESWGGEGHDLPALRRLASLACRAGAVGRAHTWGRVFPAVGGGGSGTVPVERMARWLNELLNEPPL